MYCTLNTKLSKPCAVFATEKCYKIYSQLEISGVCGNVNVKKATQEQKYVTLGPVFV